jgi:hypothetical protein
METLNVRSGLYTSEASVKFREQIQKSPSFLVSRTELQADRSICYW